MTRRTLLWLSLIVLGLSSCASTSTTSSSTASSSSSPPSSPPSRRDVADLLDAAEAFHHCAGEDADDEVRGQQLARCMEESEQRARALLPAIKAAGSMQPGPLAAVRLLFNDVADDVERDALCKQLPAGDFIADSLIDDEAHLGCGHIA